MSNPPLTFFPFSPKAPTEPGNPSDPWEEKDAQICFAYIISSTSGLLSFSLVHLWPLSPWKSWQSRYSQFTLKREAAWLLIHVVQNNLGLFTDTFTDQLWFALYLLSGNTNKSSLPLGTQLAFGTFRSIFASRPWCSIVPNIPLCPHLPLGPWKTILSLKAQQRRGDRKTKECPDNLTDSINRWFWNKYSILYFRTNCAVSLSLLPSLLCCPLNL